MGIDTCGEDEYDVPDWQDSDSWQKLWQYTLGELKEGPEALERTLELRPRSAKCPPHPEEVLRGVLYQNPSNDTDRMVAIPELFPIYYQCFGVHNLKDIRLLKQHGQDISGRLYER